MKMEYSYLYKKSKSGNIKIKNTHVCETIPPAAKSPKWAIFSIKVEVKVITLVSFERVSLVQ